MAAAPLSSVLQPARQMAWLLFRMASGQPVMAVIAVSVYE